MDLREKLSIVLITYNRREELRKTFEQILADNSPIKDFEITVLNNASTDGSTELIDEYCLKFPNIIQVNNKRNIGGCANIAKALTEFSDKEYIWVLCDNDTYDWSCWNEIENAIKQGFDVILTQKCKNTASELFHAASFLPACIYKTSNITETVTENIYDYIKYLFPHLALMAKNINDNCSCFIVSKNLVHAGINDGHNRSFIRGFVPDDLSDERRNIFWSAGFFKTLELIKDKSTRYSIIDGLRHYHNSLFELFKTAMVKNKIYYKNYPDNFRIIYKMLNFSQKIKLVAAFLVINLSLKNYRFYEIRDYEDWAEYFKKVDEQKYINKLAKKLRGNTVVLYGAGMTAEVILKNYDLSKLNIVGISDKRFERTRERDFYGIKTIKPEELNNTDFDYLLFTLKLYKSVKNSLQKSGIKQKDFPLIKKDFKYAIRN